MNYVTRDIQSVFHQRLSQFPVVAVTGPRQAGKTTLVRTLLPDWRYVNLEELDFRASARSDPRGFLSQWGPGTIIDEFQRVPELVSYLQAAVDTEGQAGQYVLTGSQSYQLHEQIAQSLAGRVGLLVLLPFAHREAAGMRAPESVWGSILAGGFPRVVTGGVPAHDWFPSFVTTCLERDVRHVLAVRDLIPFQQFVRLLASRAGQLINYASLARDTGLSIPTARQWVSVLETSWLVVRLAPWFSNERKRLVRTPKLYFADTGLLCHLLGIHDGEDLSRHTLRGQVFENWVVMETVKSAQNLGMAPDMHFYRDAAGNEVDILASARGRLVALEAKSGETADLSMARGLRHVAAPGFPTAHRLVVYAGRQQLPLGPLARAVGWAQLGDVLRDIWGQS